MIKNLGTFELYTPEKFDDPHRQHALATGAQFARSASGGDWYETTHALPAGAYVLVSGGKVVSVTADPTAFPLIDGATLLAVDVLPALGDLWNGSAFSAAPPAPPAMIATTSGILECKVAALPADGPNTAIAIDGRKPNEEEGQGTGILVYRIGGVWTTSAGTPVAA